MNFHSALDLNDGSFIYSDGKNLVSLEGLICLQYLAIRFLKLSKSSFVNLHQLKRLKIYNCDFSDTSNNCFKSLSNLEFLYISDANSYSHINYSGLLKLKVLKLENVKLDSFSIDQQSNPDLVAITLLRCFIDLAPSEILPNLCHTGLKSLKLFFDTLSKFKSSWLSNLPALKYLSVHNSSGIKTINFTNNLNELEYLCVSSNRLKRLDQSIRKLSGLRWLNACDNQFDKMLNMFEGFGQLKQLDLNGCQSFTNIDNQLLVGLDNLLKLNISNCYLEKIDSDALSHVPKLTYFNLSLNNLKLEKIDVFRHLKFLKQLDLSNNLKESSILEQGLLWPLVELELLNLSQNKITGLTIDMFRCLVELKELDMAKNSLGDRIDLRAVLGLKKIEKIVLDTTCDEKRSQFGRFFELIK